MQEQQSNRKAMAGYVVMLASVGGVALLLPGCAVGPNYKRPAINSPGIAEPRLQIRPQKTRCSIAWNAPQACTFAE